MASALFSALSSDLASLCTPRHILGPLGVMERLAIVCGFNFVSQHCIINMLYVAQQWTERSQGMSSSSCTCK